MGRVRVRGLAALDHRRRRVPGTGVRAPRQASRRGRARGPGVSAEAEPGLPGLADRARAADPRGARYGRQTGALTAAFWSWSMSRGGEPWRGWRVPLALATAAVAMAFGASPADASSTRAEYVAHPCAPAAALTHRLTSESL